MGGAHGRAGCRLVLLLAASLLLGYVLLLACWVLMHLAWLFVAVLDSTRNRHFSRGTDWSEFLDKVLAVFSDNPVSFSKCGSFMWFFTHCKEDVQYSVARKHLAEIYKVTHSAVLDGIVNFLVVRGRGWLQTVVTR